MARWRCRWSWRTDGPLLTGSRNATWLIVRLALIVALPAALYATRVIYTGKITYRFLPWNLSLAWLPLAFAYLAVRAERRPVLAVLFIAAWLAFLPNAPYLIGDLRSLIELNLSPIEIALPD